MRRVPMTLSIYNKYRVGHMIMKIIHSEWTAYSEYFDAPIYLEETNIPTNT